MIEPNYLLVQATYNDEHQADAFIIVNEGLRKQIEYAKESYLKVHRLVDSSDDEELKNGFVFAEIKFTARFDIVSGEDLQESNFVRGQHWIVVSKGHVCLKIYGKWVGSAAAYGYLSHWKKGEKEEEWKSTFTVLTAKQFFDQEGRFDSEEECEEYIKENQ